MLTGYRTEEGLWRIHLKKNVQNINTNTFMIQRISPKEAISHVFEFSSTEKAIKYYNVASRLPTRKAWNDTIRAENYDTFPGLNVKAINK